MTAPMTTPPTGPANPAVPKTASTHLRRPRMWPLALMGGLGLLSAFASPLGGLGVSAVFFVALAVIARQQVRRVRALRQPAHSALNSQPGFDALPIPKKKAEHAQIDHYYKTGRYWIPAGIAALGVVVAAVLLLSGSAQPSNQGGTNGAGGSAPCKQVFDPYEADGRDCEGYEGPQKGPDGDPEPVKPETPVVPAEQLPDTNVALKYGQPAQLKGLSQMSASAPATADGVVTSMGMPAVYLTVEFQVDAAGPPWCQYSSGNEWYYTDSAGNVIRPNGIYWLNGPDPGAQYAEGWQPCQVAPGTTVKLGLLFEGQDTNGSLSFNEKLTTPGLYAPMDHAVATWSR